MLSSMSLFAALLASFCRLHVGRLEALAVANMDTVIAKRLEPRSWFGTAAGVIEVG